MTVVDLPRLDVVVVDGELPAADAFGLPSVDVVLATPARLHHPDVWPATWYHHQNGVVALIECLPDEVAAVFAALTHADVDIARVCVTLEGSER